MKNNAVEFAEWWKSVYKEKLAAVYIDERFTNDKRYVMNEKIKQLAEQAHLYNDDDSFLIAALENFAELIVKECAKYINERTQDWDADLRWIFNDGSGDMAVDVDELLNRHFGVDE